MNLSFFIAKRYLLSKKSHNAINIISGISVLGITIGTMALVVVLSAFNGLSDLVKSLYNSFNADIQITRAEGKMFLPDSVLFSQIKQLKGVAFYCEILEEKALLKYNDQQCLATIRGVDKNFAAATHFDTLVHEGAYQQYENYKPQAVIGKGISYLLDVSSADFLSDIAVYAPKRGISSSINPEEAFNKDNIDVAGIFSINDEFDYQYMITPIDFSRKLFDYTKEVSAIEISVTPSTDIEKLKANIANLLGNAFVVKNKYEQNELLYKTLASEKLWTFIILVFIMIIATFNVIGSITMLIIEKKKDIKTLRNIGASMYTIRRIFLFQGLFITLIGVLTGLLLGTLLCYGQYYFEWIKFNESFIISAYPIKIIFTDYLLISGVVVLIGLLATWYPVRVFTKRYLLLDHK